MEGQDARPILLTFFGRRLRRAGTLPHRADQLLVFDVVDNPEYTAVVPGGRIDHALRFTVRRTRRVDNGSDWYITGAPDPRWSNEQLHILHRVPRSAFEVVQAQR